MKKNHYYNKISIKKYTAISIRKITLIRTSIDPVSNIISKLRILNMPNIYLWNEVLRLKIERVPPNISSIHFHFRQHFCHRLITSDMKRKYLSKSTTNNKYQHPRMPWISPVRTDLYSKDWKHKTREWKPDTLWIHSSKEKQIIWT